MNTKAFLTVLLTFLLFLHPSMAVVPSPRAHIVSSSGRVPIGGPGDGTCKDGAHESCSPKKCCKCYMS
ncbi:hypothetical protein LINPERPRIM_LOCUS32022, partial [Linum perenne]